MPQHAPIRARVEVYMLDPKDDVMSKPVMILLVLALRQSDRG